MGQSELKIYKVDGFRYEPYGYFGREDGGRKRNYEITGTCDNFHE